MPDTTPSRTDAGTEHSWATKVAARLRGAPSPILRRVYAGLRAVYHLRHRRICPICDGRAERFQPLTQFSPPDLLCPGCGSYARHRALWLFLTERTDLFSSELRLLHVAPEPMYEPILRSRPNLVYLSADLEASLAMTQFDVTDIPYPAESFDVILCSHVLEHVVDDRRAMSELYRVLATDGWAVIQSPVDATRASTFEDPEITDPAERERLFHQHDHVRVYGRDYKHRLEEAGFLVEVVPFADQLDPGVVDRHGLQPSEHIHVCRKPRSDAGD
jgi:SAM-dependent methyltransferase